MLTWFQSTKKAEADSWQNKDQFLASKPRSKTIRKANQNRYVSHEPKPALANSFNLWFTTHSNTAWKIRPTQNSLNNSNSASYWDVLTHKEKSHPEADEQWQHTKKSKTESHNNPKERASNSSACFSQYFSPSERNFSSSSFSDGACAFSGSTNSCDLSFVTPLQ